MKSKWDIRKELKLEEARYQAFMLARKFRYLFDKHPYIASRGKRSDYDFSGAWESMESLEIGLWNPDVAYRFDIEEELRHPMICRLEMADTILAIAARSVDESDNVKITAVDKLKWQFRKMAMS